MKLHEKIVMLRRNRGWSQSDLSKKVGVHAAHLSRIENGKSLPSVDLLWKFSKVFQVTSDFLLDEQKDDVLPISVREKSLMQRLELIEELEKQDQDTILNVMDAILTKQKISDLINKKNQVKTSTQKNM